MASQRPSWTTVITRVPLHPDPLSKHYREHYRETEVYCRSNCINSNRERGQFPDLDRADNRDKAKTGVDGEGCRQGAEESDLGRREYVLDECWSKVGRPAHVAVKEGNGDHNCHQHNDNVADKKYEARF